MLRYCVDIKKVAGYILTSREDAIKLFRILRIFCRHAEEVDLNFSESKFMSRSFADQFNKEKLNWSVELDIRINIANANSQIIEILDAASRTQHTMYRKANKTSIYTFNQEIDLARYLKMA